MPVYPRVTEILESAGLAVDYANVPEAALEHARERGQALHAAIENNHYGIAMEIAPLWATRFDAYLKFVAESGHVPLVSEFEVISNLWGFQGHPDRLGWIGEERYVFDWKGIDSLSDYAPVARQLAAYRLAWQEKHPEQPIHKTAAVQFRSNGTYRMREFTAAEMATAEREFCAACVVWHARNRRIA